ncbi:uncharacterized protein BO66DRAFT_254069 [Aspergillus aculeatinus CBS 121060]|uniref:Uncharacterized protein n=1 Tax=Aspergillus aculeatinus CBS 121060 TaxID=1448322 RepID=A0ACD1HGV0_9EURO|nr:hypothetical protein BO66DRAFT_254069 [Aspergillus aculeatinus CBS 121060]RAH73074.1 hypothetical protein BO66DRAFT_254069 [Aspergillus aculeatinus CBS 121060]
MLSSEEQQPLEEFFKAKNIRLKNEMSDDVRIPCGIPTSLLECGLTWFFRPPLLLLRLLTTKTWAPATMMLVALTVARPTKTMSPPMRISRPSRTPMSRKNMILRTRAAAATAMRRWMMHPTVGMMMRMLRCQKANGRRRSRRLANKRKSSDRLIVTATRRQRLGTSPRIMNTRYQ